MEPKALIDVCVVVPIKRPRPPAPCYVWVLVGGHHRALEVILDHDDGDARWGSTRDRHGNRVEVHVFDGDPYSQGPTRGRDPLPPLPR